MASQGSIFISKWYRITGSFEESFNFDWNKNFSNKPEETTTLVNIRSLGLVKISFSVLILQLKSMHRLSKHLNLHFKFKRTFNQGINS
jgi:hypothetical protein